MVKLGSRHSGHPLALTVKRAGALCPNLVVGSETYESCLTNDQARSVSGPQEGFTIFSANIAALNDLLTEVRSLNDFATGCNLVQIGASTSLAGTTGGAATSAAGTYFGVAVRSPVRR